MSAIRLLLRPASNHDVVPVPTGIRTSTWAVYRAMLQRKVHGRPVSVQAFLAVPGSNPAKLDRMPSEVAPGVHRLGNAYVNCYLIEDGNHLTLVDAGVPG